MTATEMSYEFDVIYDKITSSSSPGYTAKEKAVFLTKAEDIIIKRYQPAEWLERRRRDMANLTKSVNITSPSVIQDIGKPYGVRYDLPSDFMYMESEEVTVSPIISDDCLDNHRIMVIPIREDEYSLQIKNPFKKPQLKGGSFDWIWRMDFYDGTVLKRVDLITDATFLVTAYHLTYFRQPQGIAPIIIGDSSVTTQLDCELNSTVHHEIVELAVRIASGITNPQEYQIKLNEEKINN